MLSRISLHRHRQRSAACVAALAFTSSIASTTTTAAASATLFSASRCQSGGSGAGAGAGAGASSTQQFQMPTFQRGNAVEFPIVQLPAESLWCKQAAVPLSEIRTASFQRMLERLKAARSYYQYPSLSAPQIGWNVAVFTLYDDSVWINPTLDRLYQDDSCWTWEPCASCSFLMHYIERPHECMLSGYDATGAFRKGERLDGMRSRLVQHEMDHLTGVLFTRRIPNALHVVPMDGFHIMSEWADDYPSIEARSTNLYTLFFPPLKMQAAFLPDSELLKRHYEDNVYPGHEYVARANEEDRMHARQLESFIEQQKAAGLWSGSQFSHNPKRKVRAEQAKQQQEQQQETEKVETPEAK